MMKITAERIQQGQATNYAPHVYESRITIEGDRSWDRLLERQVKELVGVIVHPFNETPNDGSMDAHFLPRLTKLVRIEQQSLSKDDLGPQREIWIARVEWPYCD